MNLTTICITGSSGKTTLRMIFKTFKDSKFPIVHPVIFNQLECPHLGNMPKQLSYVF